MVEHLSRSGQIWQDCHLNLITFHRKIIQSNPIQSEGLLFSLLYFVLFTFFFLNSFWWQSLLLSGGSFTSHHSSKDHDIKLLVILPFSQPPNFSHGSYSYCWQAWYFLSTWTIWNNRVHNHIFNSLRPRYFALDMGTELLSRFKIS